MKNITKEITVPNVNIELLREQRDCLLNELLYNPEEIGEYRREMLDGIINLLDVMLDIAELGHIV